MNFAWALLILIGLTSCQREDSPRRVHESEPAVESDSVSGRPSTTPKLSTTELREFDGDWNSKLQADALENLRRNQSREDRHAFFQLVQKAAAVVSDPATAADKKAEILATFSKAIQAGCQDHGDQYTGCRFDILFASNSASVTLALACADAAGSNLQLRHRMIDFARVVAPPQNPDPRIETAFLKTSHAYMLALNASSGEVDRKRYKRLINEIGISLSRKNTLESRDHAMLAKLGQEFDVFNFERTRNHDLKAIEDQLLSVNLDTYFDDGSSHSGLRVTMAKVLGADNSTISLMKANLAKRPHLAEALGIDESKKQDFLAFLFESIWLGRLTEDETRILWNGYMKALRASDGLSTEKVTQEAQDRLLAFAKTRLFLTAQNVNHAVLDFFNRPDTFSQSDAFAKGVEEGHKGRALWEVATRNLDRLRNFADANLRPVNPNSPTVLQTTYFFSGVNRSIKLLTVYPSMLAMSYHLARLRYSITFYGYTGRTSLDAGRILEMFFGSELPLLYAYTRDTTVLNRTEIILVFHYALEMGLLDEAGVDLKLLFKLMTEQMTAAIRSDVKQIDNAFERAYELSPDVAEFQRYCALGKNAAPPMPLQHLRNYLVMGIPTSQRDSKEGRLAPIFSKSWDFFLNDQYYNRMPLNLNLETVRVDLTGRIDYLELLAKMTEQYLTRHSIADRDSTMKSIRGSIQPLKDLRKTFYSRIFRIYDRVAKCGETYIDAELDAQRMVVRGMVTHFYKVHAAMKKARETSRAPEVINKEFGFTQKVGIDELASHETALGYNNETYRMSRLQVLLRIREMLEQGFTYNQKSEAPVRAANSITLPTKLRDIDSEIRNGVIRLEWTEEPEEFVTYGLQQVFNQKDVLLSWLFINNMATLTRTQILGMSALVKAGPVETDQGIRSFPVQEMLRLTLKGERNFEVNQEWNQVLNANGQFSRFDLRPAFIIGFDNFLWHGVDRKWRGLLDQAFDRITSDAAVDTDVQSGRRTKQLTPIDALKDYANAMRSMGEPALSLPKETMQELNGFFADKVTTQIKIAVSAANEAKRLDTLREQNPAAFPSWRIYSDRRPPQVPMLGSNVIDKLKRDMKALGREADYNVPKELLDLKEQ